MLEFIVVVLGVSLFLYAFLAGADFGAGIIEILPTRVNKEEKVRLIGKAVGPVWEANHIWLILALVISFNAFPEVFWFISEWFHFPLGALAIGIIFRGASFTFLHYDPIKDKSQTVYHWIFGLSSVWCTFWLGIITGALMYGDFSISDTSVYDRYFRHWINPFVFSTGIFSTLLMVFNAALFLTAESREEKKSWTDLTKKTLVLLILAGGVVHGIFFFTEPERWKLFFLNPVSFGLIILSMILLIPQFVVLKYHTRNLSRIIAGIQLICIMCAGFYPLYPRFILFRDLTAINIKNTAAEESVLEMLTLALLAGSLFILPGYYYLMKIFKSETIRK